jgi:tetratricopeptide (TPR) repeat protein
LRISTLTESAIRRWVGEASYGRGLSYYHADHIRQPRRHGNTLRARCTGSEAQPYRVQVTLDREGIVSGQCTCYVGAGGRCKHAAALLLTWLHEPAQFLEQATQEATLEERSKAELMDLIRRMLNRYPDLETLLEIPLLVDIEHLPPMDEETVKARVNRAFYGDDEWGPGEVVPEELHELVVLGDAYAAQERYREATLIYKAVMRAVQNYYEWVHEEVWELVPIVDDCVSSLGACLEGTKDPEQRDPILRALFELYRWDVEHGGIEMGAETPFLLVGQTTAKEKARIAGWVGSAMPSPADDSWSASYRRQVYGGLLLDLAGEQADDESYLQICRETERWGDLVSRLLDLGRVDEAEAAAREQDDSDLLHLADRFIEYGHVALAENMVRERVPGNRHWRLPRWLKERAVARGDLAEALAITEELFWQRPELSGYHELRDLSRQLGQWDVRRGAILARLGDQGRHHLLTEIHLEEGELDRALETLGQVLASPRGGEVAASPRGGGELSLRVAQAAEETRPRAALHLYQRQAEDLIRIRGRANYATAAHLLTRVRDLYQRMGEPEAWDAYVADLRDQHRRLRALKEELNRAGL